MGSQQNDSSGGVAGGSAGSLTDKRSGDLERGLGLKEAVALNMIEMVGVGPFVVIPLVIKAMGGPQCLLAWAAGAVLALLDGFVWSELGAAMPLAGGSYVFLREAYGPGRMGRHDVVFVCVADADSGATFAGVGRDWVFAIRVVFISAWKIWAEGDFGLARDRFGVRCCTGGLLRSEGFPCFCGRE